MIKYKKGNLLDATEDAIGHGCNCQNVMGSGVAKLLRDKWPEVYEIDTWYTGEWPIQKSKIGKFSWVDILVNGELVKTIYNIYTQIHYLPRGKDHFEYDGFKKSLMRVAEHMKSIRLSTLALPKIGAGLAGGDWTRIETTIKEVSEFTNVDITIYEL